jgi:hypothetical protein
MTRQVNFRCGKLTLIEPLRPVFCVSIPCQPLFSFFLDVDFLKNKNKKFKREPQSS